MNVILGNEIISVNLLITDITSYVLVRNNHCEYLMLIEIPKITSHQYCDKCLYAYFVLLV